MIASATFIQNYKANIYYIGSEKWDFYPFEEGDTLDIGYFKIVKQLGVSTVYFAIGKKNCFAFIPV